MSGPDEGARLPSRLVPTEDEIAKARADVTSYTGGLTPDTICTLRIADRAIQLCTLVEIYAESRGRAGAAAVADVVRRIRALEAARTAEPEAVSPAGGRTCGVRWRVCPDHGNTITRSGGRASCTHPGCARTWQHRFDEPCPEPVGFKLTDADGKTSPVCAGHAEAARDIVAGGTVEPLPAAEPHAGGA